MLFANLLCSWFCTSVLPQPHPPHICHPPPFSHSPSHLQYETTLAWPRANLIWMKQHQQWAHYAYAALYAVVSQQLLLRVVATWHAGILAKRRRIIITISCFVWVAPSEILMTKCHINSRNGFPRHDSAEKCGSCERSGTKRIQYLDTLWKLRIYMYIQRDP